VLVSVLFSQKIENQASYVLGEVLLDVDEEKGVKLLKRSAEMGYPQAQYALGTLAHFDDEAETAGIKFYRKAAKSEHYAAIFSIGECYAEKGGGVKRNRIMAAALFALCPDIEVSSRINSLKMTEVCVICLRAL
jgi:TPR repeat protein